MFWLACLEHAPLGCQWRGLVWLSTCANKRSQLIRQPSNQERYDGAVDAPSPVSLISRFHDDTGDVPPIKFETGHLGKEAERLTRFIWNQVIQLLLAAKELEPNSLLEEFDETSFGTTHSTYRPWELHSRNGFSWWAGYCSPQP